MFPITTIHLLFSEGRNKDLARLESRTVASLVSKMTPFAPKVNTDVKIAGMHRVWATDRALDQRRNLAHAYVAYLYSPA
jgi:hypothetical protein